MKNTPLFLLVAASLVSAAVFASVFVYYPVSVAATPTAPPVIFAEGSNAGGKDLYGTNTIGVTVSQANTSLSITVHPTYQITYYKNITLIKNLDSNAYYIAFRVNTAATDTNLQSAQLIIKDSSDNIVTTINLMTTSTSSWIQIPANSQYTVDLNITYTAGASSTYSSAPGNGFTASLQLIYSPQNSESAP
ncbi:MAG TPA: hypothetical protein ENO36_00170 [Fervidicoccus fontis]|uniref:DUF1102 domain-containing protein n=1 Tax=Fervidicoccus fontis TaxID=683846 RepID=A0A7C2YGR1_9CREN|nr:hypothetical protein [Fervidicoccus fontis]